MNILLINNKVPFPIEDGANLRMYNIFSRLRDNHQVYLLCFINNEGEKEYLEKARGIFEKVETVCLKTPKVALQKKFSKLLRIFNWDFIFTGNINTSSADLFKEKIDKIIKDHSIDVMHVHLAGMAYLCYDIQTVPKLLDIPDSLSLTKERSFTSSSLERKSIYYWYEKLLLFKTKQFEKQITKHFDICTSVSEADAYYYKKLNSEINLSVIPNGVDLNYFQKKDLLNEIVPSIIFWGSMDFEPNIDAVCYFYSDIFPLIRREINDVKFYIVGSSPVSEVKKLGEDGNVVVTGYVDDIRPWVQKATICIVPMRIGSGIKNKILEAMAMSKPVVSSTLGGCGIDLIDGENILIADDPIQFALAIMELLDNKALRERISLNGRKLVEEQHDWSSTSNLYSNTYAQVIPKTTE